MYSRKRGGMRERKTENEVSNLQAKTKSLLVGDVWFLR